MEHSSGCTQLREAPNIPDSVDTMTKTFLNCTTLETAPEIPNGVERMDQCFSGCVKLVSAPPIIPKSVTTMNETFYNCKKLQGTIRIDAEPTSNNYYCFNKNTATEGSGLIVTGSSSVLDKIIKTGDASKITKGE